MIQCWQIWGATVRLPRVVGMAAIGTKVYVDGVPVSTGASPIETVRAARARGGMAWVGLLRPEQEELHELADELGLHPVAVTEAQRGHQRAKLEEFDDMTFIVLEPARYHEDSEEVELTEIDLFVGKDFIITVHDDELVDPNELRKRLEANPEVLARGPFAVVWAIFDRALEQYGPVLEGVENDIDQIEASLNWEATEVPRRIFALQREVIELQHATGPLVDMLDRMQRIVAEASGTDDAPAFRDLDDRAKHVVQRVAGFRQTLDSALLVQSTLVEQYNNSAMLRMTEYQLEQNDSMKKVSSWAAIIFAPTLIGGIYGMNFETMPELKWWFGYPLAIGAMGAMAVALYVVFKRKGWL